MQTEFGEGIASRSFLKFFFSFYKVRAKSPWCGMYIKELTEAGFLPVLSKGTTVVPPNRRDLSVPSLVDKQADVFFITAAGGGKSTKASPIKMTRKLLRPPLSLT